MPDIFAFLNRHDIEYALHKHAPVFTVEEAARLVPKLPASPTKNLLLRDGKGARHFLVVVGYDKNVDLKGLKVVLNVQKLSFASPETLKTLLGVDPGSVTLLGLMHDVGHKVELVLDTSIWRAKALQCHPLVNTATLVLSHAGIETFFRATGHEPRVLDVPSRS